MITNDDPTRTGVFPLPSSESIAGYDDDELKHSAGRAQLEEIKSFQRYSAARLTAVFMGAMACIAVPAASGVFPSIMGNLALTVVTVVVVLVFAAAVVMAIVRRNEAKAWDVARVRIWTELSRRRGDAR